VVFWLGLALLVPVGYLIYRRQQQNLASVPHALRVALSLTRILVLVLMVTVLAGPYVRLDHESEKKPLVAVLFDHSASMRLPAGTFENEEQTVRVAQAAGFRTPNHRIDADTRKALNRMSRAKLAQSVAQASAKTFLERLAKKFDVQYYAFARELTPLGIDPNHPELPEPPNPGGPSTHLGEAVGQIVTEAAGRPVAGIVLFSDGENTGGRSPAEAANAAAAAGAPVFAVPCGSPRRLSDVAIVDVFSSDLVSVGDTARVAVTVESQGFDKRPVKVELRDGEKLLDAKDLVLRSTEQQQVELTF
jgi:hypothetical protein